MDIIIALILLVIALGIIFGKPVQITITHKLEQPKASTTDIQQLQQDADKHEDSIATMDAVVQALNRMMGVSVDEQDDSGA